MAMATGRLSLFDSADAPEPRVIVVVGRNG